MAGERDASIPRGAGGRRVLVVLLAAVAVIAVLGGGVGVVLGPVTGAEVQRVAVSTSSEYRFLSGVWSVLGLLMGWSLVRSGSRAAVTRVVLICGVGGGVGRLVSLVVDGWPGGFVAALGVELILLPALLWWHVWAFPRTSSPNRRCTGSG